MSHQDIGVILDNFKIKSPDDYFRLSVKEKGTFLSRVKSSSEHLMEDVLTEIKHTPGLKMHFRVTRHPQNGWQNIPNEVFARKMAFFASKSIITFPFNEVAYWKGEDLDPFLRLLCIARPFIKNGLVSILPAHCQAGIETQAVLGNKYGLVSANFQREELEDQFEEKLYKTHVANIYLPYFSGIYPEDIIHIRHEEKRLYDGFEHGLSRLINEDNEHDYEQKLLSELREIDDHVRQLIEKFEAIQYAYRKKNIYLLIGLATIGLVMLFPSNIVPALNQLLGCSTGFSMMAYLQSKIEKANKIKGLREEKFYLFWRLNNMASTKTAGR